MMILVMLLNFGVELLLLAGTNRLAGQASAPWRLCMGAALGAVYSGACLLPEFGFLAGLLWRLVSLGLVSGLAFGWNAGAWKSCGIFSLLTMALGGAAMSLNRGGLWSVAFCGLGIWSVSQLSFQTSRIIPVEIWGRNGQVSLLALRDTGNNLRDPISGEQVLVIGGEPAGKLTGLSPEQLRHPLQSITALPGLRLIPYHSIGESSGLMLAMRFPKVKIGSQIRSLVVGFAPQGLEGEGYQALAGGCL